MAILTDNQIKDLIVAAQTDPMRGKFSQIAQELQDYQVMRLWLRKDRVQFDSGHGIDYTLMYRLAGAAQHSGQFEEDETNVRALLTSLHIDWVHAKTFWPWERRETLMNRNKARVVNHIKLRRLGAFIDIAKILEVAAWSLRDSGDATLPNGIPYYVVKNATEGFNGGLPAGHSDVAGVNLTTVPTYKNYTDQYTNVTKEDLILKMRRAHLKMGYRSPVTSDDFRGPMGRKYRIYLPLEERLTMETRAEQQNDNLGPDVASMDGQTVFKKIPLEWIPQLDSDEDAPIYMIDITSFFPVILAGDYLRESGPIHGGIKQHNVFINFVDLTYNFLCIDRRRNAVISTAA